MKEIHNIFQHIIFNMLKKEVATVSSCQRLHIIRLILLQPLLYYTNDSNKRPNNLHATGFCSNIIFIIKIFI